MTPEEIADTHLQFTAPYSKVPFMSLPEVLVAMQLYGNKMYNQAIREASQCDDDIVEFEESAMGDITYISKQSILKKLKPE